MSRYLKMLAALILGLGFSSLAQAGDFTANTDSFQVSPEAQPSIYGMEFAKAFHKHHVDDDSALDQTISLFDNSKMFVQVYTGYDFSFMGDVGTGTDGWVKYAKSLGGFTTTGGENNSGILASALWGIRLDKSNSLALDLGSIFNFGNNFTLTNGSTSVVQNLGPTVLSASLDYIVDIAKSKHSRTYLTAGAGWYHAIVNYSFGIAGDIDAGTFSGDTIGGTLGVGEELDLGGSFGLDLSVRGRYANFSRISADSVTENGVAQPGGPFSLGATDEIEPGYTVLLPGPNSEIDGSGGEIRYASLDFSGIDAKVALNLYF